MGKDGPLHELVSWPVRATIWKNESEKGSYLTLKLERRYKDSQGAWKGSSSLGRRDWLLAARLLERAHDWVDAEQLSSQQPGPGDIEAMLAELPGLD